MNIFSKLISYDKNGTCENPVAFEEKQERESLPIELRQWEDGKYQNM